MVASVCWCRIGLLGLPAFASPPAFARIACRSGRLRLLGSPAFAGIDCVSCGRMRLLASPVYAGVACACWGLLCMLGWSVFARVSFLLETLAFADIACVC